VILLEILQKYVLGMPQIHTGILRERNHQSVLEIVDKTCFVHKKRGTLNMFQMFPTIFQIQTCVWGMCLTTQGARSLATPWSPGTRSHSIKVKRLRSQGVKVRRLRSQGVKVRRVRSRGVKVERLQSQTPWTSTRIGECQGAV
jgi:hypothetical protein